MRIPGLRILVVFAPAQSRCMGHFSSFYSKLASHQDDKVPTVTPLKEKLERSVPGSQSRLPRAGLVMHAFFLSDLSRLFRKHGGLRTLLQS
jgi:hypothetical protein